MKDILIPGIDVRQFDNGHIKHQDSLMEVIQFGDCDIQLYMLVFQVGEVRPIHKHAENRVTFIRSGTCKYIVGAEETIFSEGDIIFTKPQVEHSLSVIGNTPLILAELVI